MVAVKADVLRPCLVLIAALNVLLGQTPESASRPRFDVASIKPSVPREISNPYQRSYGNAGPGRYLARNTPLQLIIANAYDIRAAYIFGGPAWVSSDGYEILARAETSAEEARSTRNGTQPMFDRDRLRLQALLEDRFSLKVHRETRQLPIFAVTVAKGGPKVQPANCITFDPNRPAVLKPGQFRPAYCGLAPSEQNGLSFKVTGSGVTMTHLLLSLSNFSDRPFIDRTGYTPTFNATVEWYVEPIQSPGNLVGTGKSSRSTEPLGPSLVTALQEQLGLKLKSTKGPIEVLVIDQVERPSAN
jgi:uncharacterized protein (TIGR03435 family)